MFKVTEDRGCSITYTEFSGTFEECQNWMNENTVNHPLNENISVHKNLYVNGNEDLFTYSIEEEE